VQSSKIITQIICQTRNSELTKESVNDSESSFSIKPLLCCLSCKNVIILKYIHSTGNLVIISPRTSLAAHPTMIVLIYLFNKWGEIIQKVEKNGFESNIQQRGVFLLVVMEITALRKVPQKLVVFF